MTYHSITISLAKRGRRGTSDGHETFGRTRRDLGANTWDETRQGLLEVSKTFLTFFPPSKDARKNCSEST
jgi:hypothetical protein